MNWLSVRILAIAGMLTSLTAIALTVTSGFDRGRLDRAWHVLVASGLPLTLACLMALRLRGQEWRDLPDKARRLRLIPAMTALTWLSLLGLGLVMFFG